MDRTFNFFKTKAKNENEKARKNSKSNGSKYSHVKKSEKGKPDHNKPAPLTKKQRQIREAIEYRFQKSKMRSYSFKQTGEPDGEDQRQNSHSSQKDQFKNIKKMHIIDLKQYHLRTQPRSNSSSQDKKQFNLRFKLRQNSSSEILTEGNQNSKTYLGKGTKSRTPSKIYKRNQEWKFVSIQVKQDLSRSKNRKTEVKINSHRSYNINEQSNKIKHGSSDGMRKYFDKVPKLKELSKLNKSKF